MPTLTLDDRTMHYVDAGQGDVVTFIHDFPLHSAMWREQVRALEPEYRLIAPDLAGCGESQGLKDQSEYSMERWADDVIALLATLDIERTRVVGAGAGADVAAAMMRRARDLVGGVGLMALRPRPNTEAEEARWAEWAEWIARDGDLEEVINHAVDDFAPAEGPTRAEAVQQARWLMAAAPADGWIGGLNALQSRSDPTPDLTKVDVPALVIAGELDAVTPPDDARAAASAIPGGGFIEIAGAGRLPSIETPGVVTAAVEELLAGREARRQTGKHPWPASPAATRTG